ncbi:MAG: hypothetical protein NC331_17535 [Lachnospiraceae bacterium]|nr:hypothetical protein [Lachnospiraceae bacterium]MCM1241146.1 hypothetical protein [Lachnospiraceae bacterium]
MGTGKRAGIFFAGILLSLALWGCGKADLPGKVPGTFAMVTAGTVPEGKKPSERPEACSPPEEQTEQEGSSPSFLSRDASMYVYNSLTDMERVWYRDIEEILGTFGTERKISGVCLRNGLDDSDIDRIFQYVLDDHPELFYVEGYSYVKYTRGDKTTSIVFSGSYSMDYDTAVERRAEIEAAADEILARIPEDASDYEKVKAVYETLIRDTEYQLDAPDDQNIYSVFVNHASVCQGYAKALQYLLERLGIECTLVQGTVDTGEMHAWNLVQLEDGYYYVDATWGDASYRFCDGGEDVPDYGIPEINYDYLCVTTAELTRTHALSGLLPMPLCDATENNYYVKEDAFFLKYDKEQMAGVFRRAAEQGRKDVAVKCADGECYQEMISAMIFGQEIFDYLPGKDGKVAYAQNDDQLSLTFWVTNE